MADLKDFLKQNAFGINGLTQSPFFQNVVVQQQKDAFHKALKEYNEEKFTLTHKELDALIIAVASGQNTYKELQDIIPNINSPTMCAYLLDEPNVGSDQFAVYSLISEPKLSYFQFKDIPEDFFYLYKFKPTDTFMLNITGKNRLYELQKEQESLILAKQSIASADAAVIWAKISVIVSIALFVLGKLLG